jgi:hypothetical protein
VGFVEFAIWALLSAWFGVSFLPGMGGVFEWAMGDVLSDTLSMHGHGIKIAMEAHLGRGRLIV